MEIASLTSQFPHCGNAFRVDLYRACPFGCQYCFSQNRQGDFTNRDSDDKATIRQIDKIPYSHGIVGELLQRRVPIHCGGMADPFPPKEFVLGLTEHLLQVLGDYPIMFSTKTDSLPEPYWRRLNPAFHVFQVSIAGIPDGIIKQLELNTASTYRRMQFARFLKRQGFTVFIRIQPLIKLEWAQQLVEELGKVVDGFTIEHIKFPLDNRAQCDSLIGLWQRLGIKANLVATGREYEVQSAIKYANIMSLKSISRTATIDVGDNDLRMLSENVNCCGLDICPPSFKNWLRHNSMAIKKTGSWDNWVPKEKCTAGLNSTCVIPGYTYADYVKRNYIEYYGNPEQLALCL